MSRRRTLYVLLLAVVCVASRAVVAQDTTLAPVKWSITTTATANDRFDLELTAQIDSGWHLYSTEKIEGGPSPTRITIVPDEGFELAGEIDSPASHSAYDPNFQVATEFYDGSVTFTIPVRAVNVPAANRIHVQVRYQTCTPTLCLPPKLIVLEASLSGSKIKSAQSAAAAVDNPIRETVTTGSLVPNFNFTDFDGQTRQFSDFRGRVVLLDFWASWCSPCLADIPRLQLLYRKYRAEGFDIVGMDSETLGQKEIDPEFAKDAQANARQIVSARGVTWTQATSETSVPIAIRTFGIENLPAKILIDRSGKVVARIKQVSELDELLPKLLTSQP